MAGVMARWCRLAALAAGMVLLGTMGWPGRAGAYEEMTVRDGGAIAGRVRLTGVPPPTRIFHMVFSPNIEFCTRISDGKGNRLLQEFRVSKEGGFQDVVVAVVGVEKGKRFDYAPRLELENCRIGPFVTPVRNAESLTIVNMDPVVHDIQGYTLKDNYTFAMFNKPLLPKEQAAKQIRMRKNHYLFRTQCGVHDFMQSWGMAVGNPYFAVTDADGRFTIPDLPPGTYDVVAWHPYMQVRSRTVTVPANGEAAVDFQFNAGEVTIPYYNLQTGYRLRPALDLISLPPPSVELQTP